MASTLDIMIRKSRENRFCESAKCFALSVYFADGLFNFAEEKNKKDEAELRPFRYAVKV